MENWEAADPSRPLSNGYAELVCRSGSQFPLRRRAGLAVKRQFMPRRPPFAEKIADDALDQRRTVVHGKPIRSPKDAITAFKYGVPYGQPPRTRN